MPYKIYTYEDPYRLAETDFWDEISSLPHFCVARTLVNGLKDVMQSSIKGLLCPLDDLVDREEIYAGWTDNISRRVHQYGTLTAWFKRLLAKGAIDDDFYLALCRNQTYFLDAIRLFIELGIPSSSFDRTKGSREQRLFADTLREMEYRELFRFPAAPDRETLKAVMAELARQELADHCKRAGTDRGDRSWYERAVEVTRRQELKAVVVHGVHQFSPAQLRLLTEMEKLGVTVIFLFNYKDTEIYDLEMRAKNYLLHDIIGKSRGGAVRAYAGSHMAMRRLFGKAWFSAELSGAVPVNPYPSFEKMAAVQDGRKKYSLHRLPKPENAQAAAPLRAEAKRFLDQSGAEDAAAVPAEWCTYCVHKGNCMRPFLTGS